MPSKVALVAAAKKPDVSALARPTLRILYQDPVHCVAMYHDIMLSVSNGEPSLSFLTRASQLIAEESRRLAGGMGLVIVIRADAKPPGEQARDHIKRTYPELSRQLRGLVRVIEGEGFGAAAKRSAVALMDLALRLHCPSKVVGNVSEGVVWLLQHMRAPDARRYAPTDVVLACHELRRMHEAANKRPEGSQ